MDLNPRITKVMGAAGSDTIASYDFYDLASGRGMTRLYCGDMHTNSGAITYKMSNVQWYSISGSWTSHSGNWPYVWNFDMKLNRPLVLSGDCIVNIPCMCGNDSAGIVSWSTIYSAELLKSGASLVSINSGACEKQTGNLAANNGTKYQLHSIGFNIPTTNLKSSDTLRLAIRLLSGAYQRVTTAYDPYGRTDPNEICAGGLGVTAWGTTTALSCQIPVKIDL